MSIRIDSVRSDDITSSLRDDPNIVAILELEQQIQLLEDAINPLLQAEKKLSKTEKEISKMNLLIDPGIGSASDKKALRNTKRQLRQRRVQLWEQLEALPVLQKERDDLVHDLHVLRRRHGITSL